jgi:hypothetical protein
MICDTPLLESVDPTVPDPHTDDSQSPPPTLESFLRQGSRLKELFGQALSSKNAATTKRVHTKNDTDDDEIKDPPKQRARIDEQWTATGTLLRDKSHQIVLLERVRIVFGLNCHT